MKTSIPLFCCIIFTPLVMAQAPEGVISYEDTAFNEYFMHTGKIPEVKGKILHLKENKEINIRYSLVVPFHNYHVRKTTTVQPDGSFELQLDYPFPYQQIWIHAGNFFFGGVYVNEGLFIELDAKKLKKRRDKGAEFQGKDGALNTYFYKYQQFDAQKKYQLSRELRKLLNRNLKMRDFTFDVFKSAYDSLFDKYRAYDNAFIRENPSAYSWIIRNERMSDYYSCLCLKHFKAPMDKELWEEICNHKGYFMSNKGMSFYNYLLNYVTNIARAGMPFDWNRLLHHPEMDEEKQIMIDSLNYFQQKKDKQQPYDRISYLIHLQKVYRAFADTLTPLLTKHTATLLDSLFPPARADFLKLKLGSKDYNECLEKYKTSLESISTPWCNALLKPEYDKVRQKLDSLNDILKLSGKI